MPGIASGPPVALNGTRELVAILRRAGVEFRLLRHRWTPTAVDEASALGLVPQTVAKTVVVRSAKRRIRAVVPASKQVDLEKLARVAGAATVSLLSEPELEAAYGAFEPGAVPPFGGPSNDRVVIDSALMDHDYVALDAGTHELSLRLHPEELIELTDATVADIGAGGSGGAVAA